MPPIVSEEYKEKKKEQILKSALSCFADKGFQSSTIDDIVSHSGISKGAIYNYFKSKDEIYLEVLNRATAKNIENIRDNFSKLRSTLSKINFIFDGYLNTNPFEHERFRYIVVFYEFTLHCTRNEKLLELLTRRRDTFINLLVDVLKEGQEAKEINNEVDPEIFAHQFWTIIDGVSLQAVYNDFPYYDVLREMKEAYIEKLKL
ncbi:TetR/AcrR family transcriptional regulator [Cytobacillus sp. FJAT-54145]|uniref:TetR/AcrR family transcriptional regulator n=1 Tax=Cytobacillus spartinae TaxID=3299023 RepID=A0ABW6KF95_9BACI